MNTYTKRLLSALGRKALVEKDNVLWSVIMGMAKANGGVR
ncbi:Uncharacterised protein [Edwardsiella hoshinae]|uniref:Uncharacterized protein n=1 Tax=Edwardsiella hoshinae TaxID=93378 RepID=A0A376DH38_9GAMM|nr:Uncharacterised protein [Edwardsiella hoshinae]